MQIVIAYVATAVVFGALDALWLGWAGKALYRPALGNLLAANFRPAPALVFYACYIAGIVWFAIRPGLSQSDPSQALATAALNGALLGALCYMTYDLTSQAVMARWPVHITVIDIAWGTFATALAATLATWVAQRFAG
ncbi:DUF2177 family protein [Novosphingobium sp. SL115]|uniref:DUF2177 family protein n=1 Tax=Novosphingobium sp. SL115 TaxID=2995150 RepID=UPI002274E554|nr:DUF2177 family protein [Novosphingobium sp. SL115]MCY1671515.1 DUF2177 family protein [Novosphingobium sp. SL115]